MNEKIKELWDKAVTLVEQEPDGDWSLDTIKDKFAELLVEECIKAVDYSGGDNAQYHMDSIKQHFGVEE